MDQLLGAIERKRDESKDYVIKMREERFRNMGKGIETGDKHNLIMHNIEHKQIPYSASSTITIKKWVYKDHIPIKVKVTNSTGKLSMKANTNKWYEAEDLGSRITKSGLVRQRARDVSLKESNEYRRLAAHCASAHQRILQKSKLRDELKETLKQKNLEFNKLHKDINKLNSLLGGVNVQYKLTIDSLKQSAQ